MAEEPQEETTTQKKKPIVMIAIAGVLIVALLAGLGIFMLKGKGGKAKKEEVKGPTTEMALGEFVVNLADTAQTRYLKATVVIEVEGAKPKGGGAHGEGGGEGGDPKVRDAVIQVLSGKHYTELISPEGKEELKKEIIAAVNERLEEGKACEVFFSDFAMQ